MKAGIIINSLNYYQQPLYLFKSLNELAIKRPDIDAYVFRENPGIFPTSTSFAIMSVKEAWSFDGPIISTDLQSTTKLINCPCPTKKYFYVWDLEWIYNKDSQFKDFYDIYQHNDINLIARSKSHYDVIKNAWKEPVGIMENFEHERLIEFLVDGR